MEKLRDEIADLISLVLDNDNGFESYVKLKKDPHIKKIILTEGDPISLIDNFKIKVKNIIKDSIKSLYLETDIEYSSISNIADNQNKFYSIPMDERYEPFSMVKIPVNDISIFKMDERDDVEGYLFKFKINSGEEIWAYQHLYPMTIPNKKNKNVLMKIIQKDNVDIFVEMSEKLLTISKNIDCLIVKSLENQPDDFVYNIITKNINLMEKHFGFEEYIRMSAINVANSIAELNLISNPDKLLEYIGNTNKKYSKIILRIQNSPVFNYDNIYLRNKINSLQRWENCFVFDEKNMIKLNSKKEVETLIDFLDERYTRSEVTEVEYDTKVKIMI